VASKQEEVSRPKVAAIALDFDGTIRSAGGAVPDDLIAQLQGLRRLGTKLVIVTGRSLFDLRALIDIDIFDALVVENGAIVVVGGKRRVLSPRGWQATRRRLLELFPSTGHEEVIVGLRREMEPEVRTAIGSAVKIEYNKEAMMLLPPEVSKGAGLKAALKELRIEPERTMAIGDGENDVSMLMVAGIAVAVRNAVPQLMQVADYVTADESGKGVSEAIQRYCGPMAG
jgi:hydroxymethylpyrimidine pyrophosphatase-like HAD family hydrolase